MCHVSGVQWLSYWIVFSLWTLIEFFLDIVLVWYVCVLARESAACVRVVYVSMYTCAFDMRASTQVRMTELQCENEAMYLSKRVSIYLSFVHGCLTCSWP